jgi:hypothetical protein
MCTVLLPPGVNPIAVNKYININIDININIATGDIIKQQVRHSIESNNFLVLQVNETQFYISMASQSAGVGLSVNTFFHHS